VVGIPLLVLLEFIQYNSGDRYWYRRLPLPLLGMLAATMLFLIFIGMSNEPAQFIYFQF
jgi:alginate O-acetyltransferase complex protein AlgI